MPHVIYLHSALTQDRIVPENASDARRLCRYTRIDVVIAMSIAGVINISMLVMAASTFYKTGLTDVDSLEGAHKTLEPILGGASSVLFALALIASGLSSSAVGTLSGQVVMQGFVRRADPAAVRRLVTMLPAFVVIAIGVDPSRTLVLSQVVLSFGIPFALIPLVYFTSARTSWAGSSNRRVTTVARIGGRSRDHRAEHVPARADLRGRRARTITGAPGGARSSGDDLNGWTGPCPRHAACVPISSRKRTGRRSGYGGYRYPVDRRAAVDPDLEVQVRPGRMAGRADVADHLALRSPAGRR